MPSLSYSDFCGSFLGMFPFLVWFLERFLCSFLFFYGIWLVMICVLVRRVALFFQFSSFQRIYAILILKASHFFKAFLGFICWVWITFLFTFVLFFQSDFWNSLLACEDAIVIDSRIVVISALRSMWVQPGLLISPPGSSKND